MFLFLQDVMIELYKRNIWNDAKTVNVITTACFSKVTKVWCGEVFSAGRIRGVSKGVPFPKFGAEYGHNFKIGNFNSKIGPNKKNSCVQGNLTLPKCTGEI